MNYEYKSCTIIGAPALDTPEAGQLEWTVQCNAGIEGDIYGFEKSDQIVVQCDMNQDMNSMITDIETACAAHIATEYPNT
mgnify:CR=1 FL=1